MAMRAKQFRMIITEQVIRRFLSLCKVSTTSARNYYYDKRQLTKANINSNNAYHLWCQENQERRSVSSH